MKKRNALSILTLIGFVILGIIFLKGHTHDLAKIIEVDLMYIIIIFILIILTSLFRGHMFKLLIENYGIKIGFKEWFGLQMLSTFWNTLLPFKGGGSIKAIYLKKKYNFPYTSSVSLTGITYLINSMMCGVLGIIFIFFIPLPDTTKYSLLIFFIILFFCSVFISFFLPLPIKTDIRILKYIADSINEFRHIRTNRLFLFKIILNSIIRFLIGALNLYFDFHAFNFGLSFCNSVITSIFLGISGIISITPMNLGLQEAVVIISAKLFGAGTLIGALAAVLDRSLSLIWIFITAPIFSYILFKEFKNQKDYKTPPIS